MRLTGHVTLYSSLGLAYCVVLQGSLSYLFCFVLGLKAKGILMAFSTMSVMMNGTNLIVIACTKWNMILTNGGKKDEKKVVGY